MADKNFILGLDLGVASVGWACISENWDIKTFIDAGVKIFQQPVEAKSSTPKNQARREARGARKNLSRKARRKFLLRKTLENNGLLLPENHTKNPYELRTKALDEKLERDELAIVLYHFGQKRGFLSNSKTKSTEDGKVKTSITRIEEKMVEMWARTLGEYRFHIMENLKKMNYPPRKFEENYTSRDMYKQEFDQILENQKKFYPNILTLDFCREIFHHIFYQRPLKIQKNLVGECSYFRNRKRANRATLIAQEFLIWKNLVDLKYKNPGDVSFSDIPFEKKIILADELQKQGSMKFWKAKKKLWLLEDGKFNFESGNKTEFEGNKTLTQITKYWKRFTELDRETQDKFVTDILTIFVEGDLEKRLKDFWHLTDEEAKNIIRKARIPVWYINYSEKALKKILPIMQKTGENDRKVIADLQKTGKFPQERNKYEEMNIWRDEIFLWNPSVNKSVTEARKIIKAIIKAYGTPTLIRIEMASDLKKGKKEKDALSKKNKENQKANKDAQDMLTERNISEHSYENILRVKLWKECWEVCPYTWKTISFTQLFSGHSEVDIEHIIPYSRSLDDSYNNLTLCYADFNRKHKWNKTPYEYWQINSEWYQEAKKRFEKLPKEKFVRFCQTEVNTDDFISRQLNDTRYTCQEVKRFCEALVGKSNVEVTKWQLTAMLRKAWDWNRFLVKGDENGAPAPEKNRADHRHHAIDALIVALTSKEFLMHASKNSAQRELLWKNGDDSQRKSIRTFSGLAPDKNFVRDFEKKLEEMIISHTANHKITWALHNDTAYGKIFDTIEQKDVFVVRKKLENLKKENLKYVVDSEVRKILEKYFDEYGSINLNNPPLHKDWKTPILSVRVKENKLNMYNFRGKWDTFFAYENNHHVEVLEHKTCKNKDWTPLRVGIIVTTLEANRRAKNKENIVNIQGPWKNETQWKEFGSTEWKFVNSLFKNDLIQYFPDANNPEKFIICRVVKFSGSDVYLQPHRFMSEVKVKVKTPEGTTKDEILNKNIKKSVSVLHFKKLQIDTLGNTFSAND